MSPINDNFFILPNRRISVNDIRAAAFAVSIKCLKPHAFLEAGFHHGKLSKVFDMTAPARPHHLSASNTAL